ncbi:DNA repair endonuclease,RAD2 endonuclease [Plasmodium gonderi]|uniref:DNA repair endonuclease,RAD2 endonuclease n=1 Tax=Plasmodium gonderi TaxID=77519 RepID=A0A1Y1JFN0_PLAGO|nr:DNA repair endonuclease,RAD2 endonuclease [Plasmodium gonderi]GAW79552.1 DNA repair endonuclease,RAD2 endonuclease [Plasmodium gonderi]
MGVKGLWSIVAPVGVRVNPEIFTGKRIAIDVSIWLYELTYANNLKVLRSNSMDNMSIFNDLWLDFSENMNNEIRTDNLKKVHLYFFFLRICKLLYYNIRPIFIFDGNPPELKRKTIFQRNIKKRNHEEKFKKTAEKLIYNYYQKSLLKSLKSKNKNVPSQKKQNEENSICKSSSLISSPLQKNVKSISEDHTLKCKMIEIYDCIKENDASLSSMVEQVGSVIVSVKDVLNICNDDDLRKLQDQVLMIADLDVLTGDEEVVGEIGRAVGEEMDKAGDEEMSGDVVEEEFFFPRSGEINNLDNEIDEAIVRKKHIARKKYYESIPENFKGFLCMRRPVDIIDISNYNTDIMEFTQKLKEAKEKSSKNIEEALNVSFLQNEKTFSKSVSNSASGFENGFTSSGKEAIDSFSKSEVFANSVVEQYRDITNDRSINGEADTPKNGDSVRNGHVRKRGVNVVDDDATYVESSCDDSPWFKSGNEQSVEKKQCHGGEEAGRDGEEAVCGDERYLINTNDKTPEKDENKKEINILELPTSLDNSNLFLEGKDEYKVYYVNNEEIKIPLFKEINKDVFEKLPVKLQYQILQDIKEEWYTDNRIKAIKAKDDMDIFSQVQLETYVRMIKTDFEIEKLKIKMAENIQNVEGELIINKELSKHFDSLNARDYNNVSREKKKIKNKKKKYINDILNNCYFENQEKQYQELYIKEEEQDEKNTTPNLVHDKHITVEAYKKEETLDAQMRNLNRYKKGNFCNGQTVEEKERIKMENEFKQNLLLLDDERIFGQDLLNGAQERGLVEEMKKMDDTEKMVATSVRGINGEVRAAHPGKNYVSGLHTRGSCLSSGRSRSPSSKHGSSDDDFENCSIEEKAGVEEHQTEGKENHVIDLISSDVGAVKGKMQRSINGSSSSGRSRSGRSSRGRSSSGRSSSGRCSSGRSSSGRCSSGSGDVPMMARKEKGTNWLHSRERCTTSGVDIVRTSLENGEASKEECELSENHILINNVENTRDDRNECIIIHDDKISNETEQIRQNNSTDDRILNRLSKYSKFLDESQNVLIFSSIEKNAEKTKLSKMSYSSEEDYPRETKHPSSDMVVVEEEKPLSMESNEISEIVKNVKEKKVKKFMSKEEIKNVLLNKVVDLNTIGKDSHFENLLNNKMLMDQFRKEEDDTCRDGEYLKCPFGREQSGEWKQKEKSVTGQGIELEKRSFYPQFKDLEESEVIDSYIEKTNRENEELMKEYKKLKKNNIEINDEMNDDIKILLDLFGIPYVQSPCEAEAQCSYLNSRNYCDAIISDDSDVLVFSGKTVIKNFFNRKKTVEVYEKKLIEDKLGLYQEELINLSLLCGCDYTIGVHGVGIVNALEIIKAFPTFEDLKKLKEIVSNPFREINHEDKYFQNEEVKHFLETHKNYKFNWIFPNNFPDREVYKCFKYPKVCTDIQKFEWHFPNMNSITKFLHKATNISEDKIFSVLNPILQKYDVKVRSYQLKIDDFFPIIERKRKKTVNDLIDIIRETKKGKKKRTDSLITSKMEQSRITSLIDLKPAGVIRSKRMTTALDHIKDRARARKKGPV